MRQGDRWHRLGERHTVVPAAAIHVLWAAYVVGARPQEWGALNPGGTATRADPRRRGVAGNDVLLLAPAGHRVQNGSIC